MRGASTLWLLIGASAVVACGAAATAVSALSGSVVLLVAIHVAMTIVLIAGLLAAGVYARRTDRRLHHRLDSLEKYLREESVRSRKVLGRGPGSLSAKMRHDTIRDVDSLLSLHLSQQLVASGMPLTNYSALPQTSALLRDEVLRLGDGAVVVELGSGATTLWMALAVRNSGKRVRIVSLESSMEWVEVTRHALRRNGVEDFVELRHAELSVSEDADSAWYARDAWEDLRDIDVLVVDGPPGASSPHARLPVVNALGSRMAPKGRVVLDDVNRIPEQEMLAAWIARSDSDGEHGAWRVVDSRERVAVLSRSD